ncbi:hypothetical protein [Aureliella helgolandensis]|uniref:Uncharacterized protein n=1 Tax=Aureliella helgolandensis TaxID=2527968 RepID=A0A518G6F0_9BACT|nr:hypothetical protein [Aureliella helgolandensis]QDV24167.1 hypothetical protein Q31a_24810 [Aureliella helgolandensis]
MILRDSFEPLEDSQTVGFHDGSVIACGPKRKPTAKPIKDRGIHIDPDGVCDETFYSPTYWHDWDVVQRDKAVTILANRINTRRSIRELVLPELQAIQAALTSIQDRLERMESVASHQASLPNS